MISADQGTPKTWMSGRHLGVAWTRDEASHLPPTTKSLSAGAIRKEQPPRFPLLVHPESSS